MLLSSQALPTGAEILKCLGPTMVSCSVLHVMKSSSGLEQKISHQSKAYQHMVCKVMLHLSYVTECKLIVRVGAIPKWHKNSCDYLFNDISSRSKQ